MHNGPEKLNEITWGYRTARVVEVANKIDLFGALSDGPLSLQEICTRCQTKPEMTEKLLIACAAMELIDKEGPLYRNTSLAQTCLVKGQPLYQGHIIAHSDTVRLFWDSLEEHICIQPSVTDEQTTHRNFIMGMHDLTMGPRGGIFTDNIDLAGRTCLLDVGGGPGTYSILACRKHPELRATVFDLPETIAIAREVIENEGMTDRIELREGDWEKDSFGCGFDVVLMSNILHGQESLAPMKLRKAWKALIHGGLLVIQEFLLNDEKTGPLTAALFNLMVGAYSRTELLAAVREAGFTNAEVTATDDRLGAAWITAAKPV